MSLRVRFKKRNGRIFVKRFKSNSSKSRAVRAWRRAGGRLA